MASFDQDFDPDGDLYLVLKLQAPEVHEVGENRDEIKQEDGAHEGSEDMSSTLSNPASVGANCSERNWAPIEVRVSAKHMILASQVFNAMLGPYFKEGVALQADNKTKIDLPDDDAAAFSILLNIIHGHSKKVPRQLDLELMTKVCLLVDKYQLHDVTDVHADNWITNLPRGFGTLAMNENFVPRLSIYWVFSRKKEFIQLLDIALWQSAKTVYGLESPVPNTVFASVENQRLRAIERTFERIKIIVEKYQTSEQQCNRKDGQAKACDALVLGTLLQSLSQAKLWPLPTFPFSGLSARSLKEKLQQLEILTLCEKMPTFIREAVVPGSSPFGTPDRRPDIFKTNARKGPAAFSPLGASSSPLFGTSTPVSPAPNFSAAFQPQSAPQLCGTVKSDLNNAIKILETNLVTFERAHDYFGP